MVCFPINSYGKTNHELPVTGIDGNPNKAQLMQPVMSVHHIVHVLDREDFR